MALSPLSVINALPRHANNCFYLSADQFQMHYNIRRKRDFADNSINGNFSFCIRVSSYICILTLYHIIPTLNDHKEEGIGKHCGKWRKCW